MATIKVNGTSYFISSSKITTPSIKINGQGYIPLFSGNKNGTVDYNRYRYTLGELKVGSYRAAVSREFINHAPTVSISSSSGYLHSGDGATLQATASDPDGDRLTYEWFRYENDIEQSQYIEGGVNNALIFVNETASSSNTTRHYWCRVTDPSGASATSNVETITWYKPNQAPVIQVSNVPSTSSNGSISFTIEYSDPDSDTCTLEYGYMYGVQNAGPGYHAVASVSLSTASYVQTISVTVNASMYWGYSNPYTRYYIVYAKMTDPSGASAADAAQVGYTEPTPTYAYKCTVECWKKEWKGGGYTSGLPVTWHVKVTALRYPSSCEGIYVFGKIGNGSGWIYKSDEIDFYYGYKPATIDLTPYVSFDNTFEVWHYNGYETVTETDQKAAGTVNTVAVSFPNNAGESHKNTYTFEWN